MERDEIEVRFLEINKEDLIKRLKSLGAKDKGEVLLEEAIIYDPELTWLKEKRFIRIRKKGDKTEITYKQHFEDRSIPPKEIEIDISDFESAVMLFERIGFPTYRRQQKKRHTFEYGDVTLDIDTWPRIPSYIELEGQSLNALRKVAEELEFSWDNAVYEDAKDIIQNIYGIPVGTMRWFTFDRLE